MILREKKDLKGFLPIRLSVKQWIEIMWYMWLLVVFGNYFYHMLAIPGRYEKIATLLKNLF